MKYSQYKILYKRFLQRPPRELIDVASQLQISGNLRDMDILDLCGGGGRLSEAALEACASTVSLVDKSFEMTEDLESTENFRILHYTDITEFLHDDIYHYDVAFCQQAINYWLTPESASDLAKILKPCGLFIFNTFNKKPSQQPVPQMYTLDDLRYIETNWLVDNMVYHVQIVESMPPDFQQFRWISPKEFREILEPYFAVEEFVKGRTSIYRCVKL